MVEEERKTLIACQKESNWVRWAGSALGVVGPNVGHLHFCEAPTLWAGLPLAKKNVSGATHGTWK